MDNDSPTKAVNYITPKLLKQLNEADSIDVYGQKRYSADKYVYCGVYFLFDYHELVYIGCSNDIYNRLEFHMKDDSKQYTKFSFIEYAVDDMKIVERFLINKYLPKYNKDTLTKKIRKDER